MRRRTVFPVAVVLVLACWTLFQLAFRPVLLDGSALWVSSVDGALGTGPSLSVQLSEGQHDMTATASDRRGKGTHAAVFVTGYGNGDSDDDGFPDNWEFSHFASLADGGAQGDFDNNGLKNRDELTAETLPIDPDTDDDGIPTLPEWAMILLGGLLLLSTYLINRRRGFTSIP